MAEKRIKCLVNGKIVLLNDKAYKIAKRFYGAVSEVEMAQAKPIELQKPLLKPTLKPTIIKPPIKQPEVIEVKEEGDPLVEATVKEETIDAGDPVTDEKPVVKKAPVKRKAAKK
jgi:hypothetical protein